MIPRAANYDIDSVAISIQNKEAERRNLLITINQAKAETIFSRLLDGYLRKEYPYDQPDAVPPQVRGNLRNPSFGVRANTHCSYSSPATGCAAASRQHRDKSVDEALRFRPRCFPAGKFRDIAARRACRHFRLMGLGFNADETARAWIQNFEKIQKHWSGDPRTIFSNVTTYEEACARIKNRGKRGGFHSFRKRWSAC